MSYFSDDLRRNINKRIKEVRARMVDQNANATGETSRSLDANIEPFDGQMLALDSLESAQEGTAPKDQGGGITEREAANWINVKGLSFDAKTLSVKINAVGSFFFENPAFERDLYDTPTTDKKLNKELTNDVAKTSVNILLSSIRKLKK